MSDESWTERRGDQALAKADAMARKRAEETRRAGALVREFAAAAEAQGLTPVRLSARSYDGRVRYRTSTYGWYLKKDRSVAVGIDGEFYVLTAPRRLASRFTGAHVSPADPPLELGRGGRDGESMPLSTALDKRLAGGNQWGVKP